MSCDSVWGSKTGPDTRANAWGLGMEAVPVIHPRTQGRSWPVSSPARCWVPKAGLQGPLPPPWDPDETSSAWRVWTWGSSTQDLCRAGQRDRRRGSDAPAVAPLPSPEKLTQNMTYPHSTQNHKIHRTFCFLEQDGETVSHNGVSLQFPSPIRLSVKVMNY